MTTTASPLETFLETERNRRAFVTNWLSNGALDDSFQEIIAAINARRETLAVQRKAELSTGDRVRVARCKPSYMVGLVGSVLRKEDKWIVIQLDPQFRRQARKYCGPDGTIRITASMIEILDA